MFEDIPRLIFTHTPDESTIEMSHMLDGISMTTEAFRLLTLQAWCSHISLSILRGSLKLSPRFLKFSETVLSWWWWDFLSQAVCQVTSSWICCLQQSWTAVRNIDLLLLCGHWIILNDWSLTEMQHAERQRSESQMGFLRMLVYPSTEGSMQRGRDLSHRWGS